jgi:hypothetical protein
MFIRDFAAPSCFPIMVSNGFERCFHRVPRSMPNKTTLYVIYPLPKILPFNVNMKTKGKDHIIFHFGNN